MTAPELGVVHIAGLDAQIGQHLRQRCCWCGALLIDYDLGTIAVPVGQDGRPGVWPFGSMVLVDGNMSVLIEQDPEGSMVKLPDNACGKLDPAVTV